MSESDTVLRTMLAAAPAAGAPIRDATCGAGGTIYEYGGTYEENVDVNKRLTLIDEDADVCSC